MALALNTVVRQIAPVIQGKILDARYEASTEKFFYLVSYGEDQTRWFEESQIEVVPDATPAA